MRICVIGSSGAMGSFFANYFISKGHTVYGYDIVKREVGGVKTVEELDPAVSDSEVILVATPIQAIKGALDEMPPTSEKKALIEIASIKAGIIRELREISRMKGYELISIHPLFGPNLQRGARMKFAVVGERSSEELLRTLFPGSELIYFPDAEEHDRAMAFLLSLTHAINIVYASMLLSHLGLERFRELHTPISYTQHLVSLSVLSQSEKLISQLQVENPFSGDLIAAFIEEISRFNHMVSSSDREGVEKYVSGIKREFGQGRLESSIRELYNFFSMAQGDSKGET